jgi:Putative prokaryotic signal transducing protein
MSPVEMERDDEQKPDTHELEQIFDTADESEALIVRGLLESNGIECLETALDAPQDVLPGVGGIVLSVRADHAAQARLMIEEYRNDAAQNPQLDDAAIAAGEPGVNAGKQ